MLKPTLFSEWEIKVFIPFQNTYTNAEKLLTAAEELAQTGECNAEEIYSVAHELERHVTSFADRVEQRRRRLEYAVRFYSQEKEVNTRSPDIGKECTVLQRAFFFLTEIDIYLQLSSWVEELRQEIQNVEAPESLEAAEQLLEQCSQQRESVLDVTNRTVAEGQTLLQELR